MADYLAPLQPNLNSITPKIKSVVAQPAIDPLKTKWNCPLCKKTMPHLVRDCHIKLHASFCCPKCNSDYPLNSLGPHLIDCMAIFTPHQFICWVCGAAECNMRHMKAKHITQLACSIPGCGKSFTPDTFVGHIKSCIKTHSKHFESILIIKPKTTKMKVVETTDNKPDQYKCLFCTSVLSKEGLLQKHIERVHIKHTCPVCTAKDITEANFRDHISKCLKKRNSEDCCPICGKSLANKTDHIHNVHATLMISCPSCKQKFKCGTIVKHTISCQKQVVPSKLCEAPKSYFTPESAQHSDYTPTPSYYERQRGLVKHDRPANNNTSKQVPTVAPGASLFVEDDFPPLKQSRPSKCTTFSEVKPTVSKQALGSVRGNKPTVSVPPIRSISPDSNSDSELTCLFHEND